MASEETLSRDDLLVNLRGLQNVLDQYTAKVQESDNLKSSLIPMKNKMEFASVKETWWIRFAFAFPVYVVVLGLALWFSRSTSSAFVNFLLPSTPLVFIIGVVLQVFSLLRYKDIINKGLLEQKKLNKFIVFVLGVYYFTIGTETLSIFCDYGLVYLIAYMFIASRILMGKYNKSAEEAIEGQNSEIEAYNVSAQEQNKVTNNQRRALLAEADEIMTECDSVAQGWYPATYLSLWDCNQFIQLIENYEANTMSEAIAIHKLNLQREEDLQQRQIENTQRRNEIHNLKKELKSELEKTNENQEKLRRELAENNAVAKTNTFANVFNVFQTAQIGKDVEKSKNLLDDIKHRRRK